MLITWQPSRLPADPRDCGHGVGLCASAPSGRLLVAFAEGFAWLHTGADATVRFAPDRLPADPAAAEAWRAAFAAILRSRRTDGALPPGAELAVNA